MDYLEIIITACLTALGLILHFLKAIIQIKVNKGKVISFRSYYLDNPHQTLFSISGAIVGYLLLFGTDELTRITALGIGYMADNVVDIIGQRSRTKLIAAGKNENASK